MSVVTIKEAAERFSSLIDDAARGEVVTITMGGRPLVAIVPAESSNIGQEPTLAGNFGDYLMSYPGGIDLVRNSSLMKNTDL